MPLDTGRTITRICPALAACLLTLGLGMTARAQTSQTAAPKGLHDFDFEVGEWRVQHRVKRADGQWIDFEGTSSIRPLMDGWANVEDNSFNRPGGGVTHGVALRAFDPKAEQWAIWWLDGRNPFGAMDPPVKGRFENGVGTFYSDGVMKGKPTRTRYTWSQITPTSAHWEQAYSLDSGKTWDTNWTMEFRRVSS
jgi:hypothetical protein